MLSREQLVSRWLSVCLHLSKVRSHWCWCLWVSSVQTAGAHQWSGSLHQPQLTVCRCSSSDSALGDLFGEWWPRHLSWEPADRIKHWTSKYLEMLTTTILEKSHQAWFNILSHPWLLLYRRLEICCYIRISIMATISIMTLIMSRDISSFLHMLVLTPAWQMQWSSWAPP